MPFTPEQVALLDRNAEIVEAVRLIRVDFRSATYRLAESVIPLTAGGQTWQPAPWIAAAAIETGGPLEAVPAIYRVGALVHGADDDLQAAYDALVLTAMHDESEWRDAPVQQWMQLYLDRVPVGPMVSMHRGFIHDITPVENADEQYLEIRAETKFAARNYTPLGEYTDRDQQWRHPGDRGCEYVWQMKDKVISGWLRG